MDGFILETLLGESWRRSSETYWTREHAQQAAEHLIKKNLARCVRILAVRVDLSDAVEELHWHPRPKKTAKSAEVV